MRASPNAHSGARVPAALLGLSWMGADLVYWTGVDQATFSLLSGTCLGTWLRFFFFFSQ